MGANLESQERKMQKGCFPADWRCAAPWEHCTPKAASRWKRLPGTGFLRLRSPFSSQCPLAVWAASDSIPTVKPEAVSTEQQVPLNHRDPKQLIKPQGWLLRVWRAVVFLSPDLCHSPNPDPLDLSESWKESVTALHCYPTKETSLETPEIKTSTVTIVF